MTLLNEDQTDKIMRMVTHLRHEHATLKKRESKISRKLQAKGVHIDQVDFFDQLYSNQDLLPMEEEDPDLGVKAPPRSPLIKPIPCRWKLDEESEEPLESWTQRVPVTPQSKRVSENADPNFSLQKFPEDIYAHDNSICKS